MRDVLLDRDAELSALAGQLERVQAGSGRVMLVEGPAGIGKSSLLAAAMRAAGARGATVLRARAGPLEQDAAWGVARQLFAPLQRTPAWSELTTGAAGLARRALDPETPEPAFAGDAMHAAAHGLVWLAAALAERGPALLVVDDVHWADAPSLRWLAQLARRLDELPLAVLCAVRAGEPPGQPDLLAELLAAVEAPVRPRALGPAAAEALVQERLPAAGPGFATACHAVTAGNPFLLGALLAQLVAERVPPTDEVAAGLSAFGPEQVARSVERQLARLPAGAGTLACAFAVLGRGAPLRQAAALAGLDAPTATRAADALHAAGLLAGEREPALAHPLVAGALLASLGPGERAQWHARAAALLAAEDADPERAALHLLRTDPGRRRPGTSPSCAPRPGARRPAARPRAPRRSCAARSPSRRSSPRPPRTCGPSSGSRSPRTCSPTRASCSARRSRSPPHPSQRVGIALRGGRAMGMAGHFEDAVDLCRRGLEHAADVAPEAVARLEAELVCNAWLRSETKPEAHARLHAPAVPVSTFALWRVNAAWERTLAGDPAADVLALLDPLLAGDARAGEEDSLLGSALICCLIATEELDVACAACAAIIDLARPRGWLIALAHGSFLRAMALVRAGARARGRGGRAAVVRVQAAPQPAGRPCCGR